MKSLATIALACLTVFFTKGRLTLATALPRRPHRPAAVFAPQKPLSYANGDTITTLPGLRCGEATTGPLAKFVNTLKAARTHLLAAAFGRGVSIFTMYPMDSIKTRIQMGQANALRLDGLFKGVGGSLIGQIPYGVLTFGSYEMYKSALLDRFQNVKPIFMVAVAAVLGDVTGSAWLFPSEVVKQKLQGGLYKQSGEAIRSIWTKKGPIGFYEGYLSALARDVPFRVAQLTTYEFAKGAFLRMKQKRSSGTGSVELSAAEAAFVGAVSGTVAAFLTCPLDRFKTLLVTDSEKWGGTIVSCATKVWQQEGPRGLLKGIVPRLSYITPSVAIFFVAYEFAQQKLQKK